MVGVEIDMVVEDSKKALELYTKIFDAQCIEKTDFPKGQNETIFTIQGTQFHLLDENPEFMMFAPKPDTPLPFWFNLVVENIKIIHTKAIQEGCSELQPVTDMPDYGAFNSMFLDPFGYTWLLHQIYREVSAEERNRVWEDQLKQNEQ